MIDESSPQSIGLPEDAEILYRPDGTVRQLKADNLALGLADNPTYTSLLAEDDYTLAALYLLQHYVPVLKLKRPSEDLTLLSDDADSLGYRQVRFRQSFNQLPVIASELVVHFNDEDKPYLIQGSYLAIPAHFDTTPVLSASDAARQIAENFPGAQIADPLGPAIWADDNLQPALVYVVPVERSIVDKASVLVDADSGEILKELPVTYTQSL